MQVIKSDFSANSLFFIFDDVKSWQIFLLTVCNQVRGCEVVMDTSVTQGSLCNKIATNDALKIYCLQSILEISFVVFRHKELSF